MNLLGHASEIAIAIWFVVSIFVEVASATALWMWLRRRHVPLIFGLTGTPGYLERAYLKWCRSQGRSGRRILVLRAISTINAILSVIAFVLMVTGVCAK